MDIIAIIQELRKELERIDGIILALETLQEGRRRGRPPKALQQLRDGGLDDDSPTVRKAAKAAKAAESKKTRKARRQPAKRK